MRPVRVAATAARAPGSTTPSTGMSSSTRSRSGATALTVLHATTSAFTLARDQVARARERVLDDRGRRPWSRTGTRAVSPR